MDLDNTVLMKEIDSSDYYRQQLMEIGERLLKGWHYGLGIERFNFLPGTPTWFVGMGSSSLIIELLQAYLYQHSLSPVYFSTQPALPKWALVQLPIIVIVCDQQDRAELDGFINQSEYHNNQTLIIDSHSGDIYTTLGHLLATAFRLQIIPDPEVEILDAIFGINEQFDKVRVDVPAALNPAKRQGGQLMGRWPMIVATGFLEPAARYWKRQLNLLSKTGAYSERILQVRNESIEGICFPELLIGKMIVLFIDSDLYEKKHHVLLGELKQSYMLEGINTDLYLTKGQGTFAQLLTALQFGDFMAYYLAIGYQVDPSARLMAGQFD